MQQVMKTDAISSNWEGSGVEQLMLSLIDEAAPVLH